MLKEVRRVSLTETIIGQMIDYIRTDLRKGEKLPPERDLMERLGVGRSSLREAMRALEAIGVVETRAREGTFASVDSGLRLRKPLEWGVFSATKTVKDIFEARRIIEIAIIPLVVQRITDPQINQMRNLLASMEHETKAKNLQKFLDFDYAFHRNLAQYSKNEVLREVITLIHRILNEERKSSLKTERDFAHALALHRRIVRAIEKRDVNAAIKAMISHMDYTKKLLNL